MPFQDNDALTQYAIGLEVCFRAFAVLSTLVLPLKKLGKRKLSILKNVVFKVYVSGKTIVKMRKYAKAIKLFWVIKLLFFFSQDSALDWVGCSALFCWFFFS